MPLELEQLECLVAIVDTGTFTDAAIKLGISQAAASRRLARLEDYLNVKLLNRTSRNVSLTSAGSQVLVRARVILREAEELMRETSNERRQIKLGHAWSAFGNRTADFQRRWEAAHPETELRIIRHKTPTGGLAEGLCDLAIVRAPVSLAPWAHALIGRENRYVALAADDRWANRRSIRLDEIPARTLAIDVQTGSTTLDLWHGGQQPEVEYTHDIDDWLSTISTGHCVGVTPESTAAQYQRQGIIYRRLVGASPVDVYLMWREKGYQPEIPQLVTLAQSLLEDKGGGKTPA